MIRFNVPPFTGKEMDYIRQAVENQKICGDGEFTRKCSEWIEERTGTRKCLLTTSCTHATELAALLAHIQPGLSCPPILLFPQRTPLCSGEPCLYLWISVPIP